ncbi:bifunctional alpha,alpha-trehalose-phosphate synthase (UDP-forming)/trehalose-phosphatase, partial [Candidatus Fermentibacterales bacterium]|nr:bifunctional alpha,alpha-trehalose-phosphate synthase (UDP-forming)/trehalose-phosphatase [Candidatus Fermentibacterales bacterium]
IGFFLHIPFPSFELFRLLPERNEIIRGLLGADLVGFHSYDYARHFLSAALRLCGHDQQLGHIDVDGRAVRVDVFPMSIDFGRFSRAPDTPGVRSEASRLREEIGDRKLILSVDRLDYTKGLLQRLEAYDLFLRDNSRYRDRVVLSLLVVPSRTSVPQYEQLKHELDEAIGRIASAYGGITTSPVLCHFGTVAFDTLAALYGIADVALVTPIRDGMNLVAKEYVATRSDERGALVLSEMAGAAMELGEALQVNPMDCHGVANAILLALEMPAEEQAARMAAMRKRIARYDVSRWAGDFVEQLEQTATTAEDGIPRLDGESKADMLSCFRESARRLLFLDYDGTLVPFRERPDKACPDDLVRELLSRLAAREGTRVVVVSGRDRETLDRFLRSLPIGLVAEHGAWLAERPGSWRQFRPLRSDWKSEIRSLMEFYVDRTPGAMVEEKAYSLAWHYRMTQPDLGRVRSRSLLVDLYSRTAGMKLDVLEGSRVIEVRNAEINKGEAALAFLRNGRWGFVLALGDDLTDEDLFRAMPRRAWTIKVGRGETRARHRLKDPDAVRAVLEELCEEEENG